jgi:hypothetical protein
MTAIKSRYILYIAFALAFAFALSMPAYAFNHGNGGHGNKGGDVYVKNNNSATVTNNIESEAETGENDADGGDGYDGGDGGDASGQGSNTGGDAGNGGDGGNGGFILTGHATSIVTVENHVNKNKTKVDLCGCEDDGEYLPWFMKKKSGDVKVKNYNSATVTNNVESEAETGENDADGGDGDSGGDGGDATGSEDHHTPWWGWGWYGPNNDGGENTGGDGGNGGDGGDGGDILTGEAYSDVYVVNKINRNVTRVRR